MLHLSSLWGSDASRKAMVLFGNRVASRFLLLRQDGRSHSRWRNMFRFCLYSTTVTTTRARTTLTTNTATRPLLFRLLCHRLCALTCPRSGPRGLAHGPAAAHLRLHSVKNLLKDHFPQDPVPLPLAQLRLRLSSRSRAQAPAPIADDHPHLPATRTQWIP